jgi:hypothetical protein
MAVSFKNRFSLSEARAGDYANAKWSTVQNDGLDAQALLTDFFRGSYDLINSITGKAKDIAARSECWLAM